jgi:ethanolamine utilization protein EutP (predicted NTPase)
MKLHPKKHATKYKLGMKPQDSKVCPRFELKKFELKKFGVISKQRMPSHCDIALKRDVYTQATSAQITSDD